MVHTRGLGKTRHVDVQYLWIQQHVAEERLRVVKGGMDATPADMPAKHLKAETVAAHLQRFGFAPQGGRATSAPWLMAAAATPGDDLWEPGQAPESRARRHNKPRLSLFIPMKVAGGPANAADVGSTMVTVGECV